MEVPKFKKCYYFTCERFFSKCKLMIYTIDVCSDVTLFKGSNAFISRSKARVCGRSLAGVTGLNPAGGMHVCLVIVVCWQVKVSATGRSLVQRSPTDYGVSLCVI
jgi:hypothetical protein